MEIITAAKQSVLNVDGEKREKLRKSVLVAVVVFRFGGFCGKLQIYNFFGADENRFDLIHAKVLTLLWVLSVTCMFFFR